MIKGIVLYLSPEDRTEADKQKPITTYDHSMTGFKREVWEEIAKADAVIYTANTRSIVLKNRTGSPGMVMPELTQWQ